MLVREVFGWLRYCLQHDPVCLAQGIVVEEIGSTFLSMMDVTDGPRTLAIFKSDVGYTPRVEIRFTSDRPQVWWVNGTSAGENGSYLLSPYSSKFPGDLRSWSRTQFVSYLIDLARSKFAGDTITFLSLIPENNATASADEVTAGPAKLDFNSFMMMVNTAKRAKGKGTKTSKNKIIDFVVKNGKIPKSSADMQIAKDAAYYLDKEPNKFNHLLLTDLVEWLDKAGIDIMPTLCSELQDAKLEKHLNQEWIDKIQKCATPAVKALRENAQASVGGTLKQKKIIEDTIKAIVEAKNTGKDIVLGEPYLGEFGDTVEAALNNELIPLPYLALLEKADYREALAPWSLIRRSVIAYEIPKENSAPIQDEILAWLEHAHLITALYKNDDDTMKELVARKVKIFADHTISNPNWVKEIYNEIVSHTNENDRARALQSEFDMWILQALSPSISASKLPLSPHAFNTGREDVELYNRVFGSWLHTLKKSAAERREQSIKSLSHALDFFYKQVVSDWKKDALEGYEPRIPSIKDIMASACRGDKDKLFQVLVADVEQELGVQVPAEVKSALVESPFFNSVYREIRFQSVKV